MAANWTDLITPDKWQYLGGCGCGGAPRKKYKRIGTGYEIQIFTTRFKFKLFLNGNLLVEKPVAELEETLIYYTLDHGV